MLHLSTEGHADTRRGEEVGRTGMFSRSCSSASLRTYALPVFFFLPSTIDLRVWSGDSFKQVSCGVSRWVSSESYVQVKVRVGSAPHTPISEILLTSVSAMSRYYMAATGVYGWRGRVSSSRGGGGARQGFGLKDGVQGAGTTLCRNGLAETIR